MGGNGDEVPDVELVVEGVRVDHRHLKRYRRVCGYVASESLPPTYPHAVAFPLHLALLTHGGAPFRAVGLVHMANEITRRRAIGSEEPLDLRVHLTSLDPHPRGQSFLIVTEAGASGEPVWEERCTIIRRLSEGRRPDGGSNAEGSSNHPGDRGGQGEPAADLPAVETWRVPTATGFRYAIASGDHNPIHVHSLPARISGLPGVVAPGMWTKARALAALEDRLPAVMTAEVEFERPIVLPARVELAAHASGPGFEPGSGLRLAVREGESGKPYMTGTVRPA